MSQPVNVESIYDHTSQWLSANYVDTVVVNPINKNSAWIFAGQPDKHQTTEARGRERDARATNEMLGLLTSPSKPSVYLPTISDLPKSQNGFEHKTGGAPVAYHQVAAPFDQHFDGAYDGEFPLIMGLHREGALAEVGKGVIERQEYDDREIIATRLFERTS
jgi:hypothetical protein